MYKKYADYNAADFAADEKFRKWVKEKSKDDELHQYWTSFRLRYPHKAEMMQEAESIVKGLSGYHRLHIIGDQKKVWNQVRQQALGKASTPPVRAKSRLVTVSLRYAAAVVSIITVAGAIWFYTTTSELALATGYGEQKTIELPDHSIIRLGANSQIRYSRNWHQAQVREVWMQGEGTFNIRHLNRDTSKLKAGHRFIVHVENDVDIEVLGTVFTVINRRGKTHVALESGSIQVRMKGQTERLTRAGQSIEAIPSESVFISGQHTTPVAHDGMVTLNNTRVSEIAALIEDNHGIQLYFSDSSLLSRKVDGALPLYKEQQALAALASILNAEVSRHNNVFTIKPKDPAR